MAHPVDTESVTAVPVPAAYVSQEASLSSNPENASELNPPGDEGMDFIFNGCDMLYTATPIQEPRYDIHFPSQEKRSATYCIGAINAVKTLPTNAMTGASASSTNATSSTIGDSIWN